MTKSEYFQVKKRFDKQYLRKRLKRQRGHAAVQFRGGFQLYWENLDPLAFWLKLILKSTGLIRRGFMNSLTFDIVQHDVSIKDLPESFKGFKILHLSDLHIDGMYDHGRRLIQHLRDLPPYDLCVMTGDFRFLTYGQIHEVTQHMHRVVRALQDVPILGVLGNHDCISMVPKFEAMGIQMLMNESMVIKKGQDRLGIAGVDDPHYYKADDLVKASEDIKNDPVKIILAHTQEVIPEAAEMGFDFYLCGHTHGGQLCLPGGVPIIHNIPRPYRGSFMAGPWKYQNMKGYTSRGAGSSCLTIRFNCPPEITLHRLV